MSGDAISWTVLQYDLRTALDVLHLPCLVKLADDKLFGRLSADMAYDQFGVRAGSVLKLEQALTLQYVNAVVMPLTCVDWFVRTKGKRFVRERSRLVGKQIQIPLDYRGKFRICDDLPSREYFNIREIVQDFPRFIRVEKAVLCAIPGCRVPQIATAGSILELDRVTPNKGTIRSRRENFLVCIDRETNRELAFGLNSLGHFTKVADNNVYELREFIDRVSLPKTVEFEYTDPRNVVSAIDSEAVEMHLILDGPLQLLGLNTVTVFVGVIQYEQDGVSFTELVTIPDDDDLMETAMVHIPTLCLDESCDFIVHKLVLGSANCDIFNKFIYLRYIDHHGMVLLKDVFPFWEEEFDFLVVDDVPPLPTRDYEFDVVRPTLRYSRSTPFVCDPETFAADTDVTYRKKRFHSEGDIDDADEFLDHGLEYDSNRPRRRINRGFSGVRRYLSQISRRMKRTASQLLFGRESDQDSSASSGDSKDSIIPDTSVNQHRSHVITYEMAFSGFVCHLNHDACQDRPAFTAKLRNDADYHAAVVSTVDCSRSYLKYISRADFDEPIYASIDWSTKRSHLSGDIQISILCPVCRECRRILL